MARLRVVLGQFKAETVRGCIRKANKHLEKLLEHIKQSELHDDEGDNEEEDQSESDEIIGAF